MTDGFQLPKRLWHTARTLPTSQAALHVSADVLAAAAAPAEAVLAVSSLLTGDLAAALLISAMLVIGGRPSARPHGV